MPMAYERFNHQFGVEHRARADIAASTEPVHPAQQEAEVRALRVGYNMLHEVFDAVGALSPEERALDRTHIRVMAMLLSGAINGGDLVDYQPPETMQIEGPSDIVDAFLENELQNIQDEDADFQTNLFDTAERFTDAVLHSTAPTFEAFMEGYAPTLSEEQAHTLVGFLAFADPEGTILTFSQEPERPELLEMHIRRVSISPIAVARNLMAEMNALRADDVQTALRKIRTKAAEEGRDPMQISEIREIGGVSWLIGEQRKSFGERLGFREDRGARYITYDPEAIIRDYNEVDYNASEEPTLPIEEAQRALSVSFECITMDLNNMTAFLRDGTLPQVGKATMPIENFFQA